LVGAVFAFAACVIGAKFFRTHTISGAQSGVAAPEGPH
jgi:hypothetical protein